MSFDVNKQRDEGRTETDIQPDMLIRRRGDHRRTGRTDTRKIRRTRRTDTRKKGSGEMDGGNELTDEWVEKGEGRKAALYQLTDT